ncbi:hypothetical protein NRIC_26230 [Enterococcus florum]|uniref:Uncharacterized protein n=1 Tax=Enterococcus florum TaxID=2480627 RepID=A0A4P5PGF6_9ENTE|nr:hypothetical protein NRIC_26230 [Enterococcus florum]
MSVILAENPFNNFCYLINVNNQSITQKCDYRMKKRVKLLILS